MSLGESEVFVPGLPWIGSTCTCTRTRTCSVAGSIENRKCQEAMHETWMVHRFLGDEGLPDAFDGTIPRDGAIGGAAPVHHEVEVLEVELAGQTMADSCASGVNHGRRCFGR